MGTWMLLASAPDYIFGADPPKKHLLTPWLGTYICTFDAFSQPDQLLDSSMFPNPEPTHGREYRALTAPTWQGGKDC